MISRRGNAEHSRITVTPTASARRSLGASAVALAVVASYVGCGGSTTTNSEQGTSEDDAGSVVADSGPGTTLADTGAAPTKPEAGSVDAAPEAGGPSSTYPAFAIDVAQG